MLPPAPCGLEVRGKLFSLRASRRGQLEAEAWAELEVELGAEARAKCWAEEVHEQVGMKPCDFVAHFGVWVQGFAQNFVFFTACSRWWLRSVPAVGQRQGWAREVQWCVRHNN